MSKHKKSARRTCQPARICIHGLTVTLPNDLGLSGKQPMVDMREIAEGLLRPKIRHVGKREKPDAAPTSVPDDWLRAMLLVATNAWRAKVKMVDADTGEAKEEMRRVYRHIEAIFEALKGIGVETIDPTGRAYDSGMALKVVSFEQTPGLSKEEIKETIKPSVSWQGRLIQMGEVIVGTPPKATDSERGADEQNNH